MTTPPPCPLDHVDGCPECVGNYEEPGHRERLDAGCVCTYRCSDCGHVWDAAWGCV